MRILITGGTGFVGSNLLASLATHDHHLFSLSRQHSNSRLSNDDEENIQRIFCDLRDPAAVRQSLKQVQPEVVVHLASISPVAYSYDHPNEVFEVNVIGTINLAEACRTEVPRLHQFMFASSSETYGLGPLPKTEETSQTPSSPYSVSKLSAERYLLYLQNAYQFPLTILRAFNTYGRRDTTSFVVERIIWQMLTENVIRLGDPSVIRDWLNINDHIGAYSSCLGNTKATGHIINFCTGRGVSVSELVDLLRIITGFKGRVEWHTLPKRPLDIPVVIGDPSKAKDLLGWQPDITLEDGLQIAVDYWRQKAKSLGLAYGRFLQRQPD